jgi:4-cresol dehydrogenase (hydroxylating)
VPSTGRHLAEVTNLAEAIVLEHGFEPQMSVSLAKERSAICVITISYDRELAGEDAQALKCYRQLAETLVERGYPPYRLNIGAMDLMGSDTAYDAVLAALRAALDPHGILAPGRYEPERPADLVRLRA